MSEGNIFENVQEELKEDQLEALSSLCRRYKEHETRIELLEERLKEEKKALEIVSREKIPALLNSTGLSELRLSTGEKVKVEDKIYASIADKNYMQAYRNMIQAEGGDSRAEEVVDSLWKSQIILEEATDEIIELLLDKGVPYESKQSIHWQTLRKYCKGRLEQGLSIPEGISAFQYQETKITI